MSDEPFFPAPRPPPAEAPYRAPAEGGYVEPVAAITSAAPPAPRPLPIPPATSKATLYTALAEELEAKRRTQQQGGVAAVVIGLVMVAASVWLTFAASGRMIFHGLALAGVLVVARGFERLMRSFFR